MYLPFNLQAYQPQMHKFINSQTDEFTNSKTPQLKTEIIDFILQSGSIFRSVLAKK